MQIAEKFMQRCFQLALKGAATTAPNPLVGAVIEHQGKIIGEGWHRRYGEAHAEVNAIHAVKTPTLLADSTLYVSLEPCAHFGKTPPCAALIIEKKIPRVVIATTDPNPKVSGRGIQMLRDAGVEVVVGVLQEKAETLNRIFITNQQYIRPYVILKWAQSADGFIDILRDEENKNMPPAQLSNEITQLIVHKIRTRIAGIMVGTNTAINDQPRLTARKWFGSNPVRLVLDRSGKLKKTNPIFNKDAQTVVFTELENYPITADHIIAQYLDFDDNLLENILRNCYHRGISSILIEGGAQLLHGFIEKNLWDEAFVEISGKKLLNGVKAAEIQGIEINTKKYLDSRQIHLKNKITRNFI